MHVKPHVQRYLPVDQIWDCVNFSNVASASSVFILQERWFVRTSACQKDQTLPEKDNDDVGSLAGTLCNLPSAPSLSDRHSGWGQRVQEPYGGTT